VTPAILVQQWIGGITPAALVAVPMFILAAEIMTRGQAEDGSILAGLRDGERFVGLLNVLGSMPRGAAPAADATENTVIGVVATNARLTKESANKVAQMAHDGLARAVRPSHTMYDGDTIFSLATGTQEADTTVVGAFAAEVVAQAIRNGVLAATSLGDVRSLHEFAH
ncbi:MAG: P1 family peptidase, partial [Anaerolineae bacterium]|nr:P1 family peptidase [Anaerolineae bacterium]